MPDASQPSDWIVSHYRVLQRLGAGGMGEVYAGLDETLKRRVALKAVKPEHRLNAAAQARFLREARILSQLDHPHICRVYDYIAAEDCDWLVLELVDGQSLQQVLKKGLDRSAAMKIAEQIAEVLVATHAAGVVHRDLKPGNVMVTAAGAVKVLDFGLARSIAVRDAAVMSRTEAPPSGADDDGLEVTRTAAPGDLDATGASDPSTFRTRAGGVSGTPMYMSPEQARGEVGTSASDMYAFGLLLQEMFTGKRAYPSKLDYAELIERVRKADTDPVRGASGDVASLIGRLTSLAPSQRPTAVETRERLKWIREKPRRRLQRLAAAAVVGAAVLGAVKYTIDLRRERTAAVLAREDADRRRGQAEGLIGFMLGDLREKLQQVGRLDVLEDVYAGATKYFASVPADALSTEEISRRSQSMHQIGLVRQQQGNLKAALEAYGESLKLAQSAVAREPSNQEWQFGLGQSHFYVGDALRLQGDLAGAMREFFAYRDIAQRIADQRPDDTRWLLERSYGHVNVSAIYEAQGDLQSARRELELAQRVKEDLVRRDPTRVEWQQAVATGHNRLGVVIDKIGDVEAALRHHLADLEIRRQLVARAPQDFSLKRSLYAALSFAARAHEDRGLLQPALDQAREAFAVTAAMAAADVRNADWQRDHAMAESRIGHLLRLAGRLDESKQHMARALAVVRPIAKAASTNLARQRDLASVEIEAGETELRLGNTRAAIAHADAADALLTPLLARKTETEAPRIAAEARLLAGAAAMRAGDAGRARALRESALAQVRALPLEMRDKRSRVIESRALLALDRAADARPLVEQLTSMGYRHPVLIEEWRTKTKGADDGR